MSLIYKHRYKEDYTPSNDFLKESEIPKKKSVKKGEPMKKKKRIVLNYTDANVFAEVKIVYCIEDIWYRYGPVSSVCALYKKAGTLDDEAPKKALTDAMTKAFSHLGVSADVFLGLFDNNKYVATMKEKFNGKATKDEGIKAKVVQINKNNKEKNNDK